MAQTAVLGCSSLYVEYQLQHLQKPLSSERWSLCIKLKETCSITGDHHLWGLLLFANSYLLWKERWVCVLLCIIHSSFTENITIRCPSATPQHGLGLIQRMFHLWFILHENKYLVALCTLQKHCPTWEWEFGNSNKALITQGRKLVLHWPLQVQHRLLHSLGKHWSLWLNL